MTWCRLPEITPGGVLRLPLLEPQTLVWFALEGWVVYLACADHNAVVDAMAKRLKYTLLR